MNNPIGTKPDPVMDELSLHILYVEDNLGLAHLLKRRMEKEGFTVELAMDGMRALDLLSANRYHAVILDQSLPGMSGIEILKMIREKDNPVPVIILTGMGNESIAVEAMKSGAYDYIIKDTEAGFLNLLPTVIRKAWEYHQTIIEKKQIEEALKASEAHYRELVESATDVIFTLDLEGRIRSINAAVRLVFDLDPKEMIGTSVFDYMDKEYHSLVREQLRLKIENHHSVTQYTIPIVSDKNHQKRYFNIRSRLRYKNGQPYEIFGIARDITEQLLAQEALRKSEERYRELINHLGEGVGIVDPDERFIFMNPAGAAMFGLSPETIKQYTLYDFLPPSSHEWLREKTLKRKSGIKEVYEIEITLSNGQNRYLMITATPRFSPEGEFIGTFGIFYDHTDKKNIEKALQQSEEKFRKAFMISPDAIGIYRLSDEAYTLVNHSFCQIIGYTEEEIIGKTEKELHILTVPDIGEKILNEVFNKGVCTNLEITFQTKNREKRWGLVSASLMALNGEPHLILMIRDITERKQIEIAGNIQHDLVNRTVGLYSVEEVFRIAFMTLMEWEEILAGGYYLLNSEEKQFKLIDQRGLSEPFIREVSTIHLHHPVFQLFQKKIIMYFDKNNRPDTLKDVLAKENLEFIAVLIISFHDQIVGLMNLVLKPERGRHLFNRFTLEMIASFLNILVTKIMAFEQLSRSEQRYKRLLENVTDYVYTVDIHEDGSAVSTHGYGCEAITGYTPEDFVQNTDLWYQMIHPEDRLMVEQYIQSLMMEKKESDSLEHRIIDRRGNIRWIRNTPVLKTDSSGTILGYDGMISDITERKTAELALRKAEEQLRRFIYSLDDAVYFLSSDGNITMLNGSCVAITGYSLQDFQKNPNLWIKCMGEEDQKNLYRFLRDENQSLPYQDIIYPIYTKDGQKKWIHSRKFAVYDGDEVIQGYYCIDRDITQQRLYEEQLETSERRYRNLIEAIPEGIAVVQNGQIVFCNNPMLRLLDIHSAEELYSRRLQDFLEIRQEHSLSSGSDPAIEERPFEGIIRKKNEVIEIEGISCPTIYNDQPATLYIIHDVSEIKQLQIKARQNEHLAAIGQMAATIAHEIRNPLGAVSLNLQYMSAELEPNPKYHNLLNNANEGVRRIQSIIHGILDFSRSQPPQQVRIRIREVLQHAIKAVATDIEKHQIRLHTEFELSDEWLMIDPHQIARVFINLFLNAIQAMKNGGDLYVRLKESDRCIIAEVEDTGVGIELSKIEKIFHPFYTTRVDGYGLGLPVVKRILDQHQATIEVKSEVKKGTVFTLTFKKNT